MSEDHICKCGRKMLLKRHGGTLIGNDTWHLYQWEYFRYECPARHFWNFWKHTAPIKVKETGN